MVSILIRCRSWRLHQFPHILERARPPRHFVPGHAICEVKVWPVRADDLFAVAHAHDVLRADSPCARLGWSVAAVEALEKLIDLLLGCGVGVAEADVPVTDRDAAAGEPISAWPRRARPVASTGADGAEMGSIMQGLHRWVGHAGG